LIAAVNTLGTFPPLAFLRVAILLILTLNFVIDNKCKIYPYFIQGTKLQ